MENATAYPLAGPEPADYDTSGLPAITADPVQDAIARALSRVLGRDLPGITAQTRLFEDLNLDSTSVLELLMAIEEDLEVEFDPDGLRQDHFASVGSLSDYIRDASR
jgi:acyl carrier protein